MKDEKLKERLAGQANLDLKSPGSACCRSQVQAAIPLFAAWSGRQWCVFDPDIDAKKAFEGLRTLFQGKGKVNR